MIINMDKNRNNSKEFCCKIATPKADSLKLQQVKSSGLFIKHLTASRRQLKLKRRYVGRIPTRYRQQKYRATLARN